MKQVGNFGSENSGLDIPGRVPPGEEKIFQVSSKRYRRKGDAYMSKR